MMQDPCKSLWSSLSQLFLDNELDETDIRSMGQVLAGSGHSVHQLEQILTVEVAPVLGWNLLVVAGEWVEFDPDWLAEVMQRQRRRNRFLPYRCLSYVVGRCMRPFVEAEWQRVRVAMRRLTADTGGLLQDLSRSDPVARRRALEELAFIGDGACSLHDLIPLLSDPDELVRESSAMTAAAVAGKEAFTPLSALLEDASVAVRRAAVAALLRVVSSTPRSAAPPWLAGTQRRNFLELLIDHATRETCLELLTAYGVTARDALDALLDNLYAKDARGAWVLARAVAAVDDAVEPRYSRLHRALRSDAEEIWYAAARCLALLNEWDPRFRGLLWELLPGLSHRSPPVRCAAALAVAATQPEDADVALHVAALLEDPSPDVRTAAIAALGRMSALSSTVTPMLLAILQKDEHVTEILRALESLGPLEPEVLAAIADFEKRYSASDTIEGRLIALQAQAMCRRG
jgi:HEAT repeat protein